MSDTDIVRKAYGSGEYGDIFNDHPDLFLGKYVFFNSSDIIFASSNKKTMTMRKMFHRALGFYGDGIEHFNQMNEDELIQVIENLKLTKKCDFDLHALITKSMANTLVRLLNGTCPTHHDCEAILEFAETGGSFISSMGFFFDFIPIIRFLPGFFRNKYRRIIASRDHMLDKFYFSVRETVDNTSGEEIGFVAKLIQQQLEINQRAGTEYISENNMMGMILDIIGASQETTSTVLANTFAIMLTHPHVAKTIREEIDEHVGSSRLPNESDKRNMHYTMATIYEVLRYTSPAALGVPHRASKDKNFEGYFVAKGTLLIYNNWYIHHDQNLWHEPWVFKPERLLDDEGKLLPHDSKERRNILTFSTGQRDCLGKNFGMSRVFHYLTAVLQSFDIEPASDGQLPVTDPRNCDLWGSSVQVKPHLCRVIPRVVPK